MISDFTKKIKSYFKMGNYSDNSSKNKTIQSVDNINELKENFFEQNNQIVKTMNKSININHNLNNFLPNNNSEENIQNLIDENSNLFLEINQLKKDIDLYNNQLDELYNEYIKLKQDYRDDLIKGVSSDNIKIEKELENEFNQLEEEKYKLKLNHLLNKNNLLKEQYEQALKHNNHMKNLYKTITGKAWIFSN